MKFGALRIRDPEESASRSLTCIALYGWGSDVEKGEWDLEDYTNYPPFEAAIKKKKTTHAPDRSDPTLNALWATNPLLQEVQSFVVLPVTDGQEVLGVLSVATSAWYDLQPLEVEALL